MNYYFIQLKMNLLHNESETFYARRPLNIERIRMKGLEIIFSMDMCTSLH